MDKNYVSLTDDELLARLKKYGLPHGPLVGTTRKLYEKKIYEYEKTLGQRQPLSRSPAVRTSSIVDKSKLQMTDGEILALLKKYGLEHGPVVASTRKLYEKKIHEYENKLKQQGSVVGAPTTEPSEKKRAKPRSSSVKDKCPISIHISTYTDSRTIQYITPEAYRNSGTTENHISQQAGLNFKSICLTEYDHPPRTEDYCSNNGNEEARTEEHNTSLPAVTSQVFPNIPIAEVIPVKSSGISGVQWKAPESEGFLPLSVCKGPIQAKTPRRGKTLLPVSQYKWQELTEMRDLLLAEPEVQPPSSKPSGPAVRSLSPQWAGHLGSGSAHPHHQQQLPDHPTPDLGKRAAQTAVQDSPFGKLHLPETPEPGPIEAKTPRREKSLLPKSTDGSQYTWQELTEMRDLLLAEAEVQPPSSKPSGPAVRSLSPQWAGHLGSDSAHPHHQQQLPDHPTPDLGKRAAQTAVQDSPFGKLHVPETPEPGPIEAKTPRRGKSLLPKSTDGSQYTWQELTEMRDLLLAEAEVQPPSSKPSGPTVRSLSPQWAGHLGSDSAHPHHQQQLPDHPTPELGKRAAQTAVQDSHFGKPHLPETREPETRTEEHNTSLPAVTSQVFPNIPIAKVIPVKSSGISGVQRKAPDSGLIQTKTPRRGKTLLPKSQYPWQELTEMRDFLIAEPEVQPPSSKPSAPAVRSLSPQWVGYLVSDSAHPHHQQQLPDHPTPDPGKRAAQTAVQDSHFGKPRLPETPEPGPIEAKTPRRRKSLLPMSQYTWQELMEMRDLLIAEPEVQPPSSKPSAPAVRSLSPQWPGHLASDSARPHHQQQVPHHPTPDLGKRAVQTTVQDSHFEKPRLSETQEPGSSMDEYKGLTDNELITRLKKYNISHGPLVGSTRKLYEKKVYEYEKETKPLSSYRGSGSYTEPSSSSESYVRETYVSPRSRETLSYGREALGSGRIYVSENYDSPRTEEYYSEYRSEDSSPSKSYLSRNYGLSHNEEQSSYTPKDWDINSSETSTTFYRQSASSLSSDVLPGSVSARQPIAEPYPYSSSRNDVSTERDSSSYQSVFHRKSSGLSSLGVEPRRAIRPELQAQTAAAKASDRSAGTKRYIPLWLQFLVFILLAGFLAFVYFYLQDGANDNPFANYFKQ
ncbi:emerin isoform X2 [Anolis sagrei]|uniref:emerin isoform X2 n=1 Tax=Anolis sagrei TaxID=38937 RepID=UPI0035208E56